MAQFYELTLDQLYQSELIGNKFYYTTDEVGANAGDLVEAFYTGILEDINAMQVDEVSNYRIKVINLGDLGDFNEISAGGAGANTGSEALPIHDAINFTLRLDTRAVRPGSKRFSGIPVGLTTNGVVSNSGYITTLNALRVKLDDPVIGAGTVSYNPVVIKRELYVPELPAKPYYRLPPDPDDFVFGNVTTVLLNLKITHQNSRGNAR